MSIELKPWSAADFAAIGDIFTRCDRSYLSDGLPLPYTREHAAFWHREHILPRDGRNGLYRVIYAGNAPAGVISLDCGEGCFACDGELSYLLHRDYEGKGLMTKAVELFCAEAFAELDILRISARVFAANAASIRVLEKNGFVPEGRIPRAALKGDTLHDLLLYGRLK